MRILIDIGHPGHVHYFRNLIWLLKSNGHSVTVVARNRDIIFKLLDHYGLEYISRGRGSNSRIGKLIYTVMADFIMLAVFIKNKIQISISFSTGYPSQVGWLLRKYSIALNDTEHTNRIHERFVYPFCNTIITSTSFYDDLGDKQIRFEGFMEGLYLNDNYFKPDNSIFSYLKISPDQKFVLLRFITWHAHHDSGQHGLSDSEKINIVDYLLRKGYHVFISAEEGKVPQEVAKYIISVPVHLIHSVLYYSEFFVSESGTMASEAAYLGNHVIYTNPLPLMGYLRESEKYELLYWCLSSKQIFEKLEELVSMANIKLVGKEKASSMRSKHIDSTMFLFKYIEELGIN